MSDYAGHAKTALAIFSIYSIFIFHIFSRNLQSSYSRFSHSIY